MIADLAPPTPGPTHPADYLRLTFETSAAARDQIDEVGATDVLVNNAGIAQAAERIAHRGDWRSSPTSTCWGGARLPTFVRGSKRRAED